MAIKHSWLFLCILASSLLVGQTVPRSTHVWIINEENHSYEEVIGSAQMPYYNQLASKYGLATQFYAEQHNSLPALMWFVAGAAVEQNSDTSSCQHSNDNVVRELLNQGYTWRSYQSNLPYAGFAGLYGGMGGSYYRRHNPLIDFSDVCPGTGQDGNSVPLTQMASDFAKGTTVNFSWVTPDVDEDGHSGSLKESDQWLQATVPSILARPEFAPGGDGMLFLVWDEGGLTSDNRCSATVKNGVRRPDGDCGDWPQVKPGYLSTTYYRSVNVLATVCAAMTLSPCPGAAQSAAPMAEFFKTDGSSGSTNGVVISTPGTGAVLEGAVHLIASATEDEGISETQVWDNGLKVGVFGSAIDTKVTLAPGQHTTTVIDLDSSYRLLHKTSVVYTVQPTVSQVQLVSPTANAIVSGVPVHVVAHASESVTVKQLQVWDNGVKLGAFAGVDVNQYFSLKSGVHTVTVLDLDESYKAIHQVSARYTVQ